MIKEKILETLEKNREIKIEDLVKEIKEHSGVVKFVIKELLKEKKIKIFKKKNPNKPKKYDLTITI